MIILVAVTIANTQADRLAIEETLPVFYSAILRDLKRRFVFF